MISESTGIHTASARSRHSSRPRVHWCRVQSTLRLGSAPLLAWLVRQLWTNSRVDRRSLHNRRDNTSRLRYRTRGLRCWNEEQWHCSRKSKQGPFITNNKIIEPHRVDNEHEEIPCVLHSSSPRFTRKLLLSPRRTGPSENCFTPLASVNSWWIANCICKVYWEIMDDSTVLLITVEIVSDENKQAFAKNASSEVHSLSSSVEGSRWELVHHIYFGPDWGAEGKP